jgi:hypothetical protein
LACELTGGFSRDSKQVMFARQQQPGLANDTGSSSAETNGGPEASRESSTFTPPALMRPGRGMLPRDLKNAPAAVAQEGVRDVEVSELRGLKAADEEEGRPAIRILGGDDPASLTFVRIGVRRVVCCFQNRFHRRANQTIGKPGSPTYSVIYRPFFDGRTWDRTTDLSRVKQTRRSPPAATCRRKRGF